MTDKWFINENGEIYDYPEDEQPLDFPNDFPTAYDTYEDAQAGMLAWYRDRCNSEFGEDHDHEDAECARMIDTMGGYDVSYDYPAYDSQMDHYERFGRPAFPNEY
jgi:hypothetical protein